MDDGIQFIPIYLSSFAPFRRSSSVVTFRQFCGDSAGFLLFSGAGKVCAECTSLTMLAFPAGCVRALRFILQNVTGPFLQFSLRFVGFRVSAERASVFR